jgi:hypothetical protein
MPRSVSAAPCHVRDQGAYGRGQPLVVGAVEDVEQFLDASAFGDGGEQAARRQTRSPLLLANADRVIWSPRGSSPRATTSWLGNILIDCADVAAAGGICSASPRT